MAYTKSYYHIVFRTHRSEPTLTEAHERDLYMYVFVTCKNKGIDLWRINSMPDHVHMLVPLPPDLSVATFVKGIKQTMGNYIRNHPQEFPMFDGWAAGYCSITYCDREREAVIDYIKNQKEHHKRHSLVDEMRIIMHEAGIDINEAHFLNDWQA